MNMSKRSNLRGTKIFVFSVTFFLIISIACSDETSPKQTEGKINETSIIITSDLSINQEVQEKLSEEVIVDSMIQAPQEQMSEESVVDAPIQDTVGDTTPPEAELRPEEATTIPDVVDDQEPQGKYLRFNLPFFGEVVIPWF